TPGLIQIFIPSEILGSFNRRSSLACRIASSREWSGCAAEPSLRVCPSFFPTYMSAAPTEKAAPSIPIDQALFLVIFMLCINIHYFVQPLMDWYLRLNIAVE